MVVTCSLEPARPRDRLDMMNMFSRNNRTYLTTTPKAIKYNQYSKAKPSLSGTNLGKSQDKSTTFNEQTITSTDNNTLLNRFPNHAKNPEGNSEIVTASANLNL
jgi:hypothetical protein